MQFPEHKCGLYLTHNDHRDYYETAETRIDDLKQKDEFPSAEDYQKAVDTNDYWCLQWYPTTPIGSYAICGTDLDALLARALRIEQEYTCE